MFRKDAEGRQCQEVVASLVLSVPAISLIEETIIHVALAVWDLAVFSETVLQGAL